MVALAYTAAETRDRLDGPARARWNVSSALAADYRRGGLSRAELAERYGLKPCTIKSVLWRQRATLPPEELKARQRQGLRRRPGRKPAWPDCPPELQGDFKRLLNKRVPASEARAVLEPPRASEAVSWSVEREWCQQCEQLVDRARAQACGTAFCALRASAT